MNSSTVGKILVLVAALAAGPTSARANVGDTLPELRGRYGSAKDMNGQMLFEVRLANGQIVPARDAADTSDHLTISVYFDGAYSAMEVFTRNNSDPAKANLSQADLDTILTAVGEGHQGAFGQGLATDSGSHRPSHVGVE